MLLFSPHSCCVALQLQLYLVSSSPNKVGQFSFECCPLSHEISSRIHHLPLFVRLACCLNPALSLCASPDLCWVLAVPLGGWLVTPVLLSDFAAFTCICSLRVLYWEFSSLPHPHSPGQVLSSTPTSAIGVRLQFTVYAFQACWGGGSVCPGVAMDYVTGIWVRSCAWWMMLTCLFCRFIQTALEPVSRERNGFSFLSVAQHKKVFHGLGVQDVAEFDSDWCSVLSWLEAIRITKV
jgi:hypothetical protein